MKQKTSLCFLSEEILDLALRNRLMGYQKIDQPWKWPKETHWIYTTSASHWPHLMKSITARQDNEFFILLQSCFLKLFEKQANFVEQFQKKLHIETISTYLIAVLKTSRYNSASSERNSYPMKAFTTDIPKNIS